MEIEKYSNRWTETDIFYLTSEKIRYQGEENDRKGEVDILYVKITPRIPEKTKYKVINSGAGGVWEG